MFSEICLLRLKEYLYQLSWHSLCLVLKPHRIFSLSTNFQFCFLGLRWHQETSLLGPAGSLRFTEVIYPALTHSLLGFLHRHVQTSPQHQSHKIRVKIAKRAIKNNKAQSPALHTGKSDSAFVDTDGCGCSAPGAVWGQGAAEALLCLPHSIFTIEDLPESSSNVTVMRHRHSNTPNARQGR